MIEEKVNARIMHVDPDFVCPLIAEHCMDAQDKYGYYAKYVLHPYCLTIQLKGSVTNGTYWELK
jgi:hypothetical protein